jgi:hypothetical protein
MGNLGSSVAHANVVSQAHSNISGQTCNIQMALGLAITAVLLVPHNIFGLDALYLAAAAGGHLAAALGPTFLPTASPGGGVILPTLNDMFTLRVARMLVATGVYMYSNGLYFELDVVECWALAACCYNPANSFCCWYLVEVERHTMGEFTIKIGGRRMLVSPCEWCMVLKFQVGVDEENQPIYEYSLIALKVGCQVIRTLVWCNAAGAFVHQWVRTTWGMAGVPGSGPLAGWQLALKLVGLTPLDHRGVRSSGAVDATAAEAPPFGAIPNKRTCMCVDLAAWAAAYQVGFSFLGGFNTAADFGRQLTGCLTVVRGEMLPVFITIHLAAVFSSAHSVGMRGGFLRLLFETAPHNNTQFLHLDLIEAYGGRELAREIARRIVDLTAALVPGDLLRASVVLTTPTPLGFGPSSGIIGFLRRAFPVEFADAQADIQEDVVGEIYQLGDDVPMANELAGEGADEELNLE